VCVFVFVGEGVYAPHDAHALQPRVLPSFILPELHTYPISALYMARQEMAAFNMSAINSTGKKSYPLKALVSGVVWPADVGVKVCIMMSYAIFLPIRKPIFFAIANHSPHMHVYMHTYTYMRTSAFCSPRRAGRSICATPTLSLCSDIRERSTRRCLRSSKYWPKRIISCSRTLVIVVAAF